ncbi:MAG: beta-N-acetylhexosaminidase [Bdellovibrionales bacterium]|nr:beta-N-acetylhexosaminidase [Bdellovibrionales bacterium]
MNIEKAIGQFIMIGLEGTRLSNIERKFLKEIKPSGVVYFKRNIESPNQVAHLSQDLFSILKNPLIGIDQEGGRVARLTYPFTEFSANAHLGNYYNKTRKLDLIHKKAKAMASELKAVGVNLNFTPVVDVHSNPKNPIIGDRAFGVSPSLVGKLAQETIKIYRRERVVSCAKHFPGHGNTTSDSHKVLPTVKASKALLMRREVVPFKFAISAGVPMIMTAHVIYPSLDPKNPATMSKCILGELLRQKLKYKGVIVSDDLEMNAIAKHQALSDAAVQSMAAGVDLLLVCKSLDEAMNIYDALSRASRKGILSTKNLETSLSRIIKLKNRYIKTTFMAPQKKIGMWSRHQKWANEILAYA